MARMINSRLQIKGDLVTAGPLHVGGLGGDADIDLNLAVDGQGQIYVPGTSLAGALRSWMLKRSSAKDVDSLWGFQKPPAEIGPGTTDGERGWASFVIVEDGLVRCAPEAIEVRDGVGIDRVTGAAAERAKYNRAILPRGTAINFEMQVEFPCDSETGKPNQTHERRAKALLGDLLQALHLGQIRLGAAKTRGLGRVRLEGLTVREQQLMTRDGMLASLRGIKRKTSLDELCSQPIELKPQPRLCIAIHWTPYGPIMVKAGHEGIAADMLPLVSGVDGTLGLVLPGSSIKGSLRSQAERIVRTVCGLRAPADEKTDVFSRQLEFDSLAAPLVTKLFGVAGKKSKRGDQPETNASKEQSDDHDPLPGLGALSVDDCFATQRTTRAQWGDIESAKDEAQLRSALNNAGLDKFQQAFHVAIDRWTGGVAGGALYSVIEPHAVDWEPIQLTLDLARFSETERIPAVCLLLLVLRDLCDGRIPLGFGVNRGMGATRVDRVEIRGADINTDDILGGLQQATLDSEAKDFFAGIATTDLKNGWTKWINEQRNWLAQHSA